MIGQPPTRKPILSAEQNRRLQRFWQRQRVQAKQVATHVTRNYIGQVMTPGGQLREIASRLAGDVTGTMAAAFVRAIRGIPIHTVPPTNGQVLRYNAAANRLDYGAAILAGHWEPLTNGDPDDPQILFTEDGDVLMGFVED